LKEIEQYDFAIIGAGAAGLQLALALLNDPFFADQSLVIFDADLKDKNDKTWCFWEKGKGLWDELIRHSWSQTTFADSKEVLKLNTSPYHYKMLRSLDFYDFAKSKIEQSGRVKWITEDVQATRESVEGIEISTQGKTFKAGHCFDSRLPEAYFKDQKSHKVAQHFKGQFLKFEEPVFDQRNFTMMDYRLIYKNTTSFMYILPVNSRQALFEYTFFSPDLVEEAVYLDQIRSYVGEYFENHNYEMTEEEDGVIPMTNFPFHKYHTKHLTKIGTAGGWVRASTGYSFKNAGGNAEKIIENLKKGQHPSTGVFKKKYHFFDTLLLNVLKYENHLGPAFFGQLYRNNRLETIFRFLDGESDILDDLKIVTSVNPWPFLKAIYRELKG
jgi:lycopene beta-cyclase